MLSGKVSFKKKWKDDKGVSEVVGTILMLAITVVLFSSIMAFVNSMPMPANRAIASFQATLEFYDPTSPGDAHLYITHKGGETLKDFKTLIVVSQDNDVSSYDISDSTTPLPSVGGTYQWAVGQTWSIDLTGIDSDSKIDVSVVDTEASAVIWASVVLGGDESSSPMILQRWVDSDTSTSTPDAIRSSDTRGFRMYVRATDSDGTISGVTINATSIGLGAVSCSFASDLWYYDFPSTTNASIYDGKALLITATDNDGLTTTELFHLSVQLPDINIDIDYGDNISYNETATGDEGFPSYLLYVHGDQGYVVMGEDETKRATLGWGSTPDLNDPKFTFTYGEEWVFIRVGTKNLKNLDGLNKMSIKSVFSTTETAPPSSTSAFTLATTSGTVYVYQAKFNSSTLAPGAYSVLVDLMSTTTEGSTPSRFQTNFILYINAQSGGSTPSVPVIRLYKEDPVANPTAPIWGEKATPFNLSSASESKIWVKISMQDVTVGGVPDTGQLSEARITDLRARSNLFGQPPVGSMLSAVTTDVAGKDYYFSIDLRFRNGVGWSAGKSAYTLRLTDLFDTNEGVYTLSTPVWIKSAVDSKNFVVGSSGFGFAQAASSNGEFQHLFQIDNNKFFTTKILDWAQDNPGGGPVMDPYKVLYFDMDGDGDRDVLAAVLLAGNNYLYVYTNRVNEYGIWEQRSLLQSDAMWTDYTLTVKSMAYGDVDADGDNDWIVAASNDFGGGGVKTYRVYLFINDYTIRKIQLLSVYDFYEMRLTDLNGDDRADLVAQGHASYAPRGTINNKIYCFNLNKYDPITRKIVPAVPPVLFTAPFSDRVWDFDVADIDDDSYPDIALSSSLNGIIWYDIGPNYNVPYFVVSDPAPPTYRILNTFASTVASDNVYEGLEEIGNVLSYVWTTSPLVPGLTTPTVSVEAYLDAGAEEPFEFYYSTSLVGPWIPMFEVPLSFITDTDTPFTYRLPSTISGAVYIKVTDSLTTGSLNDRIFIDCIKITNIGSGAGSLTFASKIIRGADTTFTCVGIGNLDGTEYLDIAAGKAGAIAGSIKFYAIDSATGLLDYMSTPAIGAVTIAPDGDTFCFKDVNGDGLGDIVSVIKIADPASPADLYDAGLYLWLNVDNGVTFAGIMIKDFMNTYGSGGASKGRCDIRDIAVENPYGL